MRIGRRDLLTGIGALGVLPGCHVSRENFDDGECSRPEQKDVPLPKSDWLRGARVAGLTAFAEATACDFTAELDRMADERVSVVEVDSELSSYLDEPAFSEQLRVLDLVARESHARGMRCIAYWPILEVLTANAETTTHTMSKDHPDWVQIGIDGNPNVFVGGEGRAFWIDPGEESAWLCPTSGYVEWFLARLERLARTAVDGLWGDVPLLNDIVGEWPCVNASCKARFKASTGHDAPSSVNWNDPVFVRWVTWRHQLLFELEQRIVQTAKRVRSDFEVVIETVTMDYNAATVQGLDGAYADNGVIHRVWEVDAVSDASAMRQASHSDWSSMAVMMKYARGASGPRASWVFCYGEQEEDAERVMALAIATGSSPYETRIPQMNTSVGSAYRKRMYQWLERHPEILLSTSANSVAVLYSSTSRDVVDRARANGLYISTNAKDALWWSDEEGESTLSTEYVADFRGFCTLLMDRHVPFDVLTTPHAQAETLARYAAVVVSSAASMAPDLVERFRAYVHGGGVIVVTGADAGSYDELGGRRSRPMLLDALGVEASAGARREYPLGAGRVLYFSERLGQTYLRSKDGAIADLVASFVGKGIGVNAPEGVVFDVRSAEGGELVVACANFAGLGAQGVDGFTPRRVTLACALDVGGRSPTSVTITRPDAGARDVQVPVEMEGTRIRLSFEVSAIAVAIVAFSR
ncbi:MAG TPA: alpha-amylase family protein [Labilithrix sp.]|nr:alpha-amylase family protein [Labilithrix sp.]